MDIFFRIIGFIALINEKTSRFRINFIPINIAIIIGLGFLFGLCVQQLIEGAANIGAPRRVMLTDILAHNDMTHNYISVAGVINTKESIVFTSDGKEESAGYVPLSDPEGNQAILVRIEEGKEGFEALDHNNLVRVTGLLRKISSDHKTPLEKQSYQVGGFRVDEEYELIAGAKPTPPMLMIMPSVLLLLVLLAMVATMIMRYTVFRSTNEVIGSADGKYDDVPRVTGKLLLPERNASRQFLNVPSFPVVADDGKLLFVSNIDASSRFFGVKTNNLNGYWLLIAPPGSLRFTSGRFYVGIHSLPALRLQYTDVKGKQSAAVFSFKNENDRARMAGWLKMTPEQRQALKRSEEKEGLTVTDQSDGPAPLVPPPPRILQ